MELFLLLLLLLHLVDGAWQPLSAETLRLCHSCKVQRTRLMTSVAEIAGLLSRMRGASGHQAAWPWLIVHSAIPHTCTPRQELTPHTKPRREGAEDSSHWAWQRRPRLSTPIGTEDVVMTQGSAVLQYGWEYLGAGPRAVHDPQCGVGPAEPGLHHPHAAWAPWSSVSA